MQEVPNWGVTLRPDFEYHVKRGLTLPGLVLFGDFIRHYRPGSILWMAISMHFMNDFWLIGINYRQSDTALRGRYALSKSSYLDLLDAAADFGVPHVFVLSTCNRTEIYGFSKDPLRLSSLLCQFTEGSHEAFLPAAYHKKGQDALSHLFHVAAGLDSQILGDYEIISQIKEAIRLAGEQNRVNAFIDRLFRTVLQSAREIRSKTRLSSGSISVAFAAVQYFHQRYQSEEDPSIVVVGAGQTGTAVCKNLLDIRPDARITLLNRSPDKAEELAVTLGLQTLPFSELKEIFKRASVFFFATDSPSPLADINDFGDDASPKLILDLSVPNNVAPEVADLSGIELVNVDELSRISDETLRMREAEIPKAKAIITFHIHQFAEWLLMQRNVPVIKAVKEKLLELNKNLAEARQDNDEKAMQHVINSMALKMKNEERRPGCNYIEALNGYLTNLNRN